jgi:hypothetical protein
MLLRWAAGILLIREVPNRAWVVKQIHAAAQKDQADRDPLNRSTTWKAEGPGMMPRPFDVRGPSYMCDGTERGGVSSLMAILIVSPCLGLLLTRTPLFLYAFRLATARFHLIQVPSRWRTFSASLANLILPLRISCH